MATAQASASASASAPALSLALPAELPHLDNHQLCREGTCKVDAAIPDKPGYMGAPVMLWEHEVGVGATLAFARNDAVTVIAVVLAGQVTLKPDDLPKQTTAGAPPPLAAFGPLQGFSSFGAGLELTAGATSRLLLASVAELDPDRQRKKGKPWKVRPGGESQPRRFDLSGQGLRWGGGAFGAVIGLEESADHKPPASVTLLGFTAPDGVPEHAHKEEVEALAILSGAGALRRFSFEGEAYDEPVKPGSTVYIARDTRHAFRPTSLPTLAIQLYVPAGPEQRFKKLAEAPPPAP